MRIRTVSGWDLGCCERSSETSSSINGGEFLGPTAFFLFFFFRII
jgi:hypothetical protein